MNQTRMMYGFIDEMEKTAVIPLVGAAAGMAARAAPWLLRAGKSALTAVKPLASKALSFAKTNPFLASSMMSSGASVAGSAANMIRPPKIQQPMGKVQGIKPAPTDSSAMRTNFG